MGDLSKFFVELLGDLLLALLAFIPLLIIYYTFKQDRSGFDEFYKKNKKKTALYCFTLIFLFFFIKDVVTNYLPD